MGKLKANIKVDVLNPQTIQAAIDALSGKGAWIERKCGEISQALAEIGMREAIVSYEGAVTDGNADVSVRVYPIPNGYAVEAYGEDVFFVEFGTGIAAGNGYELDEITPSVSIEPGSYSQTEGKGIFTAEHPYWWYSGRRYTGTRPYMGMYHASKKIKTELTRVAEEVFSRD